MSDLRADQARLALSASGMGTWRWELDTGALTWDEALERVFDLEPGTFAGTFEAYIDLLHPDDRDAALAVIQRSLETGEEHRVEHRIIDRQGEIRWIAGWGRVTHDTDARVTGMVGVGADITERKRTEDELREKEVWIRRLQRITSAVAGAADVSAIAEVVIEQGASALGAHAGVLALVGDGGDLLEMVADSGFPSGALDRWRSFSIDADIPVATAARTGTPIWGVPTEELASRSAVFGEWTRDTGFGQIGMVVVVPLSTTARTIGSLGLRFAELKDVSEREREFMEALARQAAQAIDRARLYEAERESRLAAEEVDSRLAFLSRASEVLSSSLDPDETLRELARLVVPALADWCLVEMAEPEGSIRTVAIMHTDPEKVRWVRDVRRRQTPSEEGVGYVIRSGEPIIVSGIQPEAIAAVARDEEHLRLLTQIGLTSVMIVPIGSHGVTVGAISMFNAESGRLFAEDDLAFAREIARRASIAVENAQLHDAERAARRDAERVVDRLARLQAVTSSLSKAATEREVAKVIVREGLTALRADAGGVWLAEPDGVLRVIEAAGYPSEVEDDMRATPERPGPVAEASSGRDIVVVASPEEFDARWPHLRELRAQVGDHTVAAAPMVLDDHVLGVVYIAYRQAHEFDAEERGFLVTLARQCAQAIDRARLYEAERTRLQLERDARADADRARRRLQQLQAITEAGLAQLSLDESLALMLERLRDAIACDTAAVLLIDEAGRRLELRGALGFDGRGVPVPTIAIGPDVLGRVATSGVAAMMEDLGDRAVPPYLGGEIASVAVTPLRASGEILGVLHAGSRTPRTFEPDDLELIDLAAERIALAVDRAQVFEREHRIAETLQLSLLPEALPEVPGVELAARYLPGGAGVQVGGDWYEVVPLADGHLAAAVGDVVGRGIRAAAAMGQFRNAMRALALEGLSPARLLERLSELSIGLGREFATALALRLDPVSGVLTYSSAGHPPPLVIAPDGTPALLDGGRSTPLGVEPGIAYPEAAAMLEPGSTLVLYTDGLIERRGQALDEGLRGLLHAAEHPADGVEALLDGLREHLAGEEHRDDDVAMLAIRYVHAPRRLELRFPSTAQSIARFRGAVRDWLTSESVAADDIEDVILAVSEACSNAVEHAGAEGGDVAVTVELRGDEVRLSVRDAGRWRPPRLRFERGRGFRILRAVMHEVEVTRRADGTEVHMRRALRHVVPTR